MRVISVRCTTIGWWRIAAFCSSSRSSGRYQPSSPSSPSSSAGIGGTRDPRNPTAQRPPSVRSLIPAHSSCYCCCLSISLTLQSAPPLSPRTATAVEESSTTSAFSTLVRCTPSSRRWSASTCRASRWRSSTTSCTATPADTPRRSSRPAATSVPRATTCRAARSSRPAAAPARQPRLARCAPRRAAWRLLLPRRRLRRTATTTTTITTGRTAECRNTRPLSLSASSWASSCSVGRRSLPSTSSARSAAETVSPASCSASSRGSAIWTARWTPSSTACSTDSSATPSSASSSCEGAESGEAAATTAAAGAAAAAAGARAGPTGTRGPMSCRTRRPAAPARCSGDVAATRAPSSWRRRLLGPTARPRPHSSSNRHRWRHRAVVMTSLRVQGQRRRRIYDVYLANLTVYLRRLIFLEWIDMIRGFVYEFPAERWDREATWILDKLLFFDLFHHHCCETEIILLPYLALYLTDG